MWRQLQDTGAWRFLIKEVMSFLISQRDILIIHCGCLHNFILSGQSF